MQITHKIYTVGHSDRDVEEFLSLLNKYGIGILVDIRAYPYSRRFPYFSKDELRQHIKNSGIDYYWAGNKLGGMRKLKNPESHPALSSESFRGFAEHMETEEFQQAIIRLQNFACKTPTVIMCAEKQASNCHRSLISDYLTFKNMPVEHIIDETSTFIHSLNNLARCESEVLVYDRNTSRDLFS